MITLEAEAPLLEGKPVNWGLIGGVLLVAVVLVSLSSLIYFMGQLGAPAETSSMPIPVLQRARPLVAPQGTVVTASPAARSWHAPTTPTPLKRQAPTGQQPPPPPGVTAM